MKKVYAKPQIMFEDFSLSTSIASCSIEINASEYVCGQVIDEELGITVFFSDWADGCTTCNPDPNLCYHGPMTRADVFGS